MESLNAKLSTHTAPNRSGGGQQQQPLVHDTLLFEIEEGIRCPPASMFKLVASSAATLKLKKSA
jgi:hypothetical protein